MGLRIFLIIVFIIIIFLPRKVRLIVSLTTLLVLYTLFNNTSDALPPTAYIKMIDVWFFSCILLLFYVIVSHVVVEHLGNRNTEIKWVKPFSADGHKVSDISAAVRPLPDRVLLYTRCAVVPVVVVLFNLVYWAVLFGLRGK